MHVIPELFITIVCSALCLVSCDCVPSEYTYGSVGTTIWNTADSPLGRPSSADTIHLHPVGVFLVIWMDCTAQGTNAGERSTYRVSRLLPDDRRVDWQCRTEDGRTGSVTINGNKFDLAKGGLFLVSTKSGTIRVRQINPKSSKLTDYDALAEAHPQIQQFFNESLKTD